MLAACIISSAVASLNDGVFLSAAANCFSFYPAALNRDIVSGDDISKSAR
jgi:hypothetical protein